MTDYFALLSEPRRPWLEPEALRQKFLALSATVHPDRVHTLGEAERAAAHTRYTQLNAAHQCLREPKDRLRHLLELEGVATPTEAQRIPSDLMDLSLEIGKACRDAERVVAEKSRTTSPLLQVQLFAREQAALEQLQSLRREIDARVDRLTAELKQIDAAWSVSPDSNSPERATRLQRLGELGMLFSYFARWTSQMQESLVRLSI